MMKRKKRILIGGSIVLIAAICGAIFLFSGKTQPTKSLAKQVEEDYTGIEEIINQAVEKNENLAMSSNPYEYVKNNSYYDRLVSKGISILPILEKKINENQYGDGLLGYITAIAIEDITECNLKEDKDLQWATVSEFGDSWKKFKKTAKEKIDADISKITIVNEVTPDKIHIPAGEQVSGIFVLHVMLKRGEFDVKTIETLFKLIPQNILFVLEYEGKSKLAI